MSWAQARRLLCIRLDNIGDVLMTTPAFAALKAAVPARHLTLLTSTAAAALQPHLSDIDDIIVHDASWTRQSRSDDEHRLIERLAIGRYDAAVIFTVCTQSPLPAAMICRLAGIPLRAAYCRENPYGLLTDWLRERDHGQRIRHEVQRQLDLVTALGTAASTTGLRMTVRPQDHEGFERAAREAELDLSQPWVLVHPGATAASRRYPAESFATAARLLWEQRRWLPVFGGSDAERGLVETIRAQAGVPSRSLAGRLALGEYAAAIAAAPLLISNNSAPIHIAAAVQTPVVALYALTNPQHTPWQVRRRVLFRDVDCRNCLRSVCPQKHHRCLRGAPPAAVLAAADALVAQRVTALAA